jgi:hypothetical protein
MKPRHELMMVLGISWMLTASVISILTYIEVMKIRQAVAQPGATVDLGSFPSSPIMLRECSPAGMPAPDAGVPCVSAPAKTWGPIPFCSATEPNPDPCLLPNGQINPGPTIRDVPPGQTRTQTETQQDLWAYPSCDAEPKAAPCVMSNGMIRLESENLDRAP